MSHHSEVYFDSYFETINKICCLCSQEIIIQKEVINYSDGYQHIVDTYNNSQNNIYNIYPVKHFQELNNHCYHKLSHDKTHFHLYHSIYKCKCDIIRMRNIILNYNQQDLLLLDNKFLPGMVLCEMCIRELIDYGVCINIKDYMTQDLTDLFNNFTI